EALAKKLWEKRFLLFTAQEHLDEEGLSEVQELVAQDSWLQTLRAFLGRVRGIFQDSKGELGARQRLGRLRVFAQEHSLDAFDKAIKFLDNNFEHMITFLRIPGVRRNSLAETGMRTLRRLEQGHDGFRASAARDRYVRLFEANRYGGWCVYRRDGTLGFPAPQWPLLLLDLLQVPAAERRRPPLRVACLRPNDSPTRCLRSPCRGHGYLSTRMLDRLCGTDSNLLPA